MLKTLKSELKAWRQRTRELTGGSVLRKGNRHTSHRRRRVSLEKLEDRYLLTAGTLDTTFGDGGMVLTNVDITPGSDDYAYDMVAYQSDGKSIVVGQSLGDMVAIRYHTDGSIDDTFGDNGVARVDAANRDAGQGLAIDSADRILIVGRLADFGYSGVARLTPDGLLDTTFDGDGRQRIDFGTYGQEATSITVDSHDRVVVAGRSGADFAVARLTTSGAYDTDFDNDGVQTVDFYGSADNAYDVTVDTADRILLTGYAFGATSPGADMAVARLTTTGSLDATFGSGGKQTIDFGGGRNDAGRSVAVDSLGRVILAGSGGTSLDFAVTRLTTDGVPDSTFDGDGKQTIDFGGGSALALSVTADSDNRVVVAGVSNRHTSTGADFTVTRLTSVGQLDSSFAGDGKQTIDFNGRPDSGRSVAIDNAGRVLLAGFSIQAATGPDFALARLDSAGELDTDFGNGGRVTTDIGTPTGDIGRDVIAYQSNGQSIVVGWANNNMAVARYRVDGSLDTSFGSNGIVEIAFSSGFDRADSVAIDSLDRIIVVGQTNQGTSTGSDFAVARLTSNGALDPTFSNDGKQTIDFGSTSDLARAVAVDNADRILVAGDSYQGSSRRDFAVARLTSAGVLDTSFHVDGKQTVDFGGNDYGHALDVDEFNRPVIGGYIRTSTYDFAVTRLTASGFLDTSFSGDGRQVIDFGGRDLGLGVALDSRNRVLVSGRSDRGTPSGTDFAVARLTTGGALDTSFASDGRQTIDFGSFSDSGESVAVDSIDRVVIAGYALQPGSSYDFAVAQLMPDGTLDLSFDTDGKQTIDFGGQDLGQSVAIDTEGRILVAGYSRQPLTSDDLAVARLLSNRPPTADAGGPYVSDEGASLTLDASASSHDTESTSSLTYQWDFNYDGNSFDVEATGIKPTVSFDDNFSSRTIAVRVTSSAGLSDIATTTLEVANVSPTAVLSGADLGVPGQSLAFQLGATDPSSVDEASRFVWTIDWDGDGTTDQTISGHRGRVVYQEFPAPGTYPVTVTATDKDGGLSPAIRYDVTVVTAALLPDSCHPGLTALYVGGTADDDKINLSPGSASGEVEVTLNGTPEGVFTPTGRIVVYALAGNDDVQVTGDVANDAWIFGGDGNDRLKGGVANDVLLGDDGDDLLVGKRGRDLLIGGRGSDRIIGQTDDDILISGWLHTYSSQHRDQLLCSIMQEWTSNNSYLTRVNNLKWTLQPGETVLDASGDKDVLTGAQGDDWFFFDGDEDRVTDLHDEVFEDDLDWVGEFE